MKGGIGVVGNIVAFAAVTADSPIPAKQALCQKQFEFDENAKT